MQNISQYLSPQSDLLAKELFNLDHKLFYGGKYIRSKILEQISENLKLNKKQAFLLANSVEMIQNATLCHDDVIDTSEYRRGVPSLWKALDNRKSILIGDLILARVLIDLSKENNPVLIQEMSSIIYKLVEGEYIQGDLKDRPQDWNKDNYKLIARCKTGSLFSWCFTSPIIFINKLPNKAISQAREIGENIGEAFQIRDDIMDFHKGRSKRRFEDLKNTNINYVLLEKSDLCKNYRSHYESKILPLIKSSITELNSFITCITKEITLFNTKYKQDFFNPKWIQLLCLEEELDSFKL